MQMFATLWPTSWSRTALTS